MDFVFFRFSWAHPLLYRFCAPCDRYVRGDTQKGTETAEEDLEAAASGVEGVHIWSSHLLTFSRTSQYIGILVITCDVLADSTDLISDMYLARLTG